MCKSILQRKHWSSKFNLSTKIIYDLFSEFVSIMLICRNPTYRNIKDPQNSDPVDDILPIKANTKLREVFFKEQAAFTKKLDAEIR